MSLGIAIIFYKYTSGDNSHYTWRVTLAKVGISTNRRVGLGIAITFYKCTLCSKEPDSDESQR